MSSVEFTRSTRLLYRTFTFRITDPALRLARLNGRYPLKVGDEVVVTDRGEKLGSVQLRYGRLIQYGKLDGKAYPVPVVKGSGCQQQPDRQDSSACHECHAYER